MTERQRKNADAGDVTEHQESKRRRVVSNNPSSVVDDVVGKVKIPEMGQAVHREASHPEVKKTVKCNPRLAFGPK